MNDDGTFNYQQFEDDLFTTDTFSFGTQIGQITNTCSTICGLMAEFDKDSKEFEVLCNRLKAGCAAQSRQIDKTKIGEDVKTLGTICKQYQRIDETKDTPEQIQEKMFYNRILADKKPYFFRYKYKALAKEYKEYKQKADENAELRFGKSLEVLQNLLIEDLSENEKNFLMYYNKYLPVIDSACVMNKICKYIEKIDFHIKQKVRTSLDFDYKALLSSNNTIDNKLLKQIEEILETTFKEWEKQAANRKVQNAKTQIINQNIMSDKFEKEAQYLVLSNKLQEVCSNSEKLANHLVYYFYVVKPSSNKGTLWRIAGKEIYENVKQRKTNIKSNTYAVDFPIKDNNGDLQFMYDRYQIKHLVFQSNEKESNIDD